MCSQARPNGGRVPPPRPAQRQSTPEILSSCIKFNSKIYASAAELVPAPSPQRDASDLVFVDSQQADPVHLR